MKINIELDNLECCNECGIVFDKTVVNTKKTHWDTELYICPLCKNEMYSEEEIK